MTGTPPTASPVAVLRSTYHRRIDAPDDAEWFGTFDVDVEALDGFDLGDDIRLVLWCAMLLEPTTDSNVEVVERLAGRLVLIPAGDGSFSSRRWTIPALRSSFPARHANDGPEAAYLVDASGDVHEVRVVPATREPADTDPHPATGESSAGRRSSATPLVPHPVSLAVAETGGRDAVLHLDRAAAQRAEMRSAWNTVRSLARRLGVGGEHGSLAPVGDETGTAVEIEIGPGPAPSFREGYRLHLGRGTVRLVAGSDAGVRHGLITLAQWATGSLPIAATVTDAPAFEFRGVHLDVARQWYEPDVIDRLIDLAAWRKLNRVHLHLTDDEAWRFPVTEYPDLATIGGARGHGLALPPLCASGPLPTGRAYTADEIGGWVTRAHELGVVLVPEVDVPGHCHAALTAVPLLRDPDDTSAAFSVQGYPNNVLVPGHPATMPFLRAVFTSLAELFERSPVLHIGGDEVPNGAWAGSPMVTSFAQRRGLTSTRQIEAAFHRQLIDMIRTETGREVAMWEEAALAGVEPNAYTVSWTSPEAAMRVAAAGHRVVISPGQAYYLDMASGRDWELPGASWAGTVPLDSTCEFDPTDGFDDATDVHGIQACIWSEHVTGLDVLDRLVYPRLDAVAERAWTGHVIGGADDLATRAASLPRFVPG